MENIELCIDCKKRPIYIKKRGLCMRCYGRFCKREGRLLNKKDHVFSSSVVRKKSVNGEILFIQNYFDHKEWVHHPAIFYFDGERYSPDFYDSKRNIFIEVSATRQAYHKNKNKYDKFQKYYPQLKFEIRNPKGELLSDLPYGDKWAHQYEPTG